MEKSEAVTDRIKRRVHWLERFYRRIISCRVVVESPHRHHRKGNLYSVRVSVRVPGGELITRRSPSRAGAHKNIAVAIRDSFDSARRELEDFIRKQRGDIKHKIRAG